MHCSVLSNHKEVQQNTTHEDNMNAATENRNLTTKTGNGNKHQQNRKKIRNKKKIKNQTKNRKKRKSFAILSESMLKHFNDGWEISKKHNKVFPAQKYDV